MTAPVAIRWIVVDWAGVKNFGNATTHSVRGLDPGRRRLRRNRPGKRADHLLVRGRTSTFPGDGPGLGNAGVGDPDSGVNWGAENRDGSSGVSIPTAPANGSEFFINTSPPAAGGTQTITFDLKGTKTGAFDSVAEMTSNITPGTTQVVQTVHVTR